MAEKISYVVHKDVFWPTVVALALLALFLAIAVWASIYGEGGTVEMPSYPIVP